MHDKVELERGIAAAEVALAAWQKVAANPDLGVFWGWVAKQKERVLRELLDISNSSDALAQLAGELRAYTAISEVVISGVKSNQYAVDQYREELKNR